MTERGLKNINVFIQRLQTFFFVTFLRFLTFFLNFIWNVFYIYGFINQYLFASEHVDLFSDCWFTFSFLSRLLKAKTSKCWTLFGKKKRRWIGHILRKHDGLLHEIIEGKMEGKTTRGRRRFQMLYDSANDGGFVALKRAAEDREGWRHRERMSKTCCTAEDCSADG